ncbi:hypothetical protein LINPERHAP1_LOCUS38380 [Linum perenne]
MCSEFRSFLGSNPEMLLPEKDLEDAGGGCGGPLQFRLFQGQEADNHCEIFTPISQDLTSSSDDDTRRRKEDQEAPVQQLVDEICVNDYPDLAVELPSSSSSSTTTSGKELVDEDLERSTPSSPHRTIPAVLPCPPAPRKPKSRPITTKRKLAAARRVVFVDLSSDEIASLFSPRAADLQSGEGSVKKARQL